MYKALISVGGWQEFQQISFESATITNYYDGDYVRYRTRLDGDLLIFGNSFDIINEQYENGLLDLPIEIYENDNVIFSGSLILDGEYSYGQRKCILSCEQNDVYTKILQEIDIKRDVNIDYINYSADSNGDLRYYCLGENTDVIDYPTENGADEWERCSNDYVIGDFPYYDNLKLYTKADKIIDENGYGLFGRVSTLISSVGGSFVRTNEGFVFACIQNCRGVYASIDNPEYWDLVNVTKRFGQTASFMKFDGGFLYDGRWGIGGCGSVIQDLEYRFTGKTAFTVLQELLGAITSEVTVNQNTFLPISLEDGKNIVLTLDDVDIIKQSSLEDIINIFKIIYNVDWEIQNNSLVFVNPSELANDVPVLVDNEYNYIDRVYAKDWSSETFSKGVSAKYKFESLTIGAERSIYFQTQRISYDLYQYDTIKHEYTGVEVDISTALINESGNYIAVLVDPETNKVVYEDWYNGKLMPFKLIQLYYIYGNPFSKGTLLRPFPFDDIELTLDKGWLYETKIDIPYPSQMLVNEKYLLVSTFGNLRLKEISVNLQSASSVITATKQ